MNYRFICYAAAIIFSGCNKVTVDTQSYTASLQVINAIPKFGEDVKVSTVPNSADLTSIPNLSYYFANGMYENGSMLYGLPANLETPLKVVLSKDTLVTVFNEKINAKKDASYSLFIAGQPAFGLLINDSLPRHTDSVTGIRFIHLSPNAGPLNIHVLGEAPGSAVDHLQYQQYTSFLPFPADAAHKDYLFEIVNADTEEPLYYFYYDNTKRFGNITVLLRGLWGGGPDFEAIQVNH